MPNIALGAAAALVGAAIPACQLPLGSASWSACRATPGLKGEAVSRPDFSPPDPSSCVDEAVVPGTVLANLLKVHVSNRDDRPTQAQPSTTRAVAVGAFER